VQTELDKQGVEATLDEIKVKRRTLCDSYIRDKGKTNNLSEHYKPCAVLMKDLPESVLAGTAFDYWEEKRRAYEVLNPEYSKATFRRGKHQYCYFTTHCSRIPS